MGDVVLVDDLHDQRAPADRHQGGVAGGHVDRDGHHLIERRGADAQGVAARRQDDPLAVRAAADLLLSLVDKGLWFVGPIRHRRHEQGAHAGRHDRRVSRELFCRGRGSPPVQGLRDIRRRLSSCLRGCRQQHRRSCSEHTPQP